MKSSNGRLCQAPDHVDVQSADTSHKHLKTQPGLYDAVMLACAHTCTHMQICQEGAP